MNPRGRVIIVTPGDETGDEDLRRVSASQDGQVALGSLFSQPWWLDAVAPGCWSEVVVENDGRVVARMPYVMRRRLGMRLLAMPLLTSSITTVLMFVPLAMAPHSAGEYLRSMSQVILISLFVSWLLAMTVTPILCARFLEPPDVSVMSPVPASSSATAKPSLSSRC